MIVLFPYLARIEEQPQWKTFIEHNRFFLRGLLIIAGIPALLVFLGFVSRHLSPGAVPAWTGKVLGTIWIVFAVYFAAALALRQQKLPCPRCGQRFFGRMRWKYDLLQ